MRVAESAVPPGQPRANGNEGGNHPTRPGESGSGRGPGECKGPEACWRSSKKGWSAREEQGSRIEGIGPKSEAFRPEIKIWDFVLKMVGATEGG